MSIAAVEPDQLSHKISTSVQLVDSDAFIHGVHLLHSGANDDHWDPSGKDDICITAATATSDGEGNVKIAQRSLRQLNYIRLFRHTKSFVLGVADKIQLSALIGIFSDGRLQALTNLIGHFLKLCMI